LNSIDRVGVHVVDVATAKVQDVKARASTVQFVGEGEHVLAGTPEPIQCRVASDQRAKCPIKLGS
jgi:hypothetical protein